MVGLLWSFWTGLLNYGHYCFALPFSTSHLNKMHPTGHRGAHGQGARSQVDAQGFTTGKPASV